MTLLCFAYIELVLFIKKKKSPKSFPIQQNSVIENVLLTFASYLRLGKFSLLSRDIFVNKLVELGMPYLPIED